MTEEGISLAVLGAEHAELVIKLQSGHLCYPGLDLLQQHPLELGHAAVSADAIGLDFCFAFAASLPLGLASAACQLVRLAELVQVVVLLPHLKTV